MENKVDKEAILKRAMSKKYCSKARFDFLDEEELPMIYEAMESYSASQNSELKKENELYKNKVEFYREATNMCREFVFANKDVGYPSQPLWDAVYDKLTDLKKENEELKKKVNDLQQADMTHEYNNAEAARVWPQIEEQIREDEREKLESTIIEKDRQLKYCHKRMGEAYNEIYKTPLQNKELKECLHSAEEELDDVKDEANDYKDSLTLLKQSIIDKDKEIAELKNNLEGNREIREGLETISAEQQRTINELRNMFESIFLLCEEDGKPIDGYRFRELIIEAQSLLSKLKTPI